jgi:hypothetical protein
MQFYAIIGDYGFVSLGNNFIGDGNATINPSSIRPGGV